MGLFRRASMDVPAPANAVYVGAAKYKVTDCDKQGLTVMGDRTTYSNPLTTIPQCRNLNTFEYDFYWHFRTPLDSLRALWWVAGNAQWTAAVAQTVLLQAVLSDFAIAAGGAVGAPTLDGGVSLSSSAAASILGGVTVPVFTGAGKVYGIKLSAPGSLVPATTFVPPDIYRAIG